MFTAGKFKANNLYRKKQKDCQKDENTEIQQENIKYLH